MLGGVSQLAYRVFAQPYALDSYFSQERADGRGSVCFLFDLHLLTHWAAPESNRRIHTAQTGARHGTRHTLLEQSSEIRQRLQSARWRATVPPRTMKTLQGDRRPTTGPDMSRYQFLAALGCTQGTIITLHNLPGQRQYSSKTHPCLTLLCKILILTRQPYCSRGKDHRHLMQQYRTQDSRLQEAISRDPRPTLCSTTSLSGKKNHSHC
jgi:hypothetical protein